MPNRRILVVDDNESIHDDFRKILGQRPASEALDEAETRLFGEPQGAAFHPDFEVDSAAQGREGLERLQAAVAANRPYALAFVDVRMPPGWDGIETTAKLWEVDPDLQVVICTAYSDYGIDEMLNRLGSSDRFLILKKPFDNIEVLQLANALTEKYHLMQQARTRVGDLENKVATRTAELHSTNERLRAEIVQGQAAAEALQATQQRLNHLLAQSPVVIYSFRVEPQNIVPAWISENIKQMLGCTVREWCQLDWREAHVHPDDRLHAFSGMAALIDQGQAQLEYRVRHADGTYRFIRDESKLLRDELTGDAAEIIGAYIDITDRKQLEEQLRQSQKMEAIGQLAGGVAHDFNNLLTIIRSYTTLILESEQLAPEIADQLKQVCKAADRAADLTRQLLAYGRRQVMRRQQLDLNELVTNLAKMLSRILGEDIALEVQCSSAPCPVEADWTMIEQILLNLAANARDAMMKGGRLTLQTSTGEFLAGSLPQHPEARPGPYACLAVSDSGCGIDPAILPRIFEPFFTTKDVGKGTGLGLATVYGIVKLHKGWTQVETKLQQGTTFRIYLPLHTQPAQHASEVAPPLAANVGSATILFVEDEPALRKVARTVLERSGYRILEAGTGLEALAVWKDHHARIDVLITDMVMPAGLTGRELATRLHQDKPELKVLYTSGYSDELVASNGVAPDEADFLPKPYSPQMLLSALRATINRAPAA
ncbi:MAG: response regulator [Verrucomicrobiota bacterium]